VVDALAEAMTSSPGVVMLDAEMDAAHNRCVISMAGEPEALIRGLLEAVGKAVELIDLRQHQGEHPRMGAADVIPLIPISGITMDDCIQLSLHLAQQIAERYRIPTYLYERSARIPLRQELSYIRKGGFEVIREEIRTNPERKPDFGPAEAHPSAGVTAVGARAALIAYNVYLNTPDVKIAQAIAKAVRYSSGGLKYVKALGFEIKERNQVQVSMNLTNFEETGIYRAFQSVSNEAVLHGVVATSSEIVGLIPQKALDDCAEACLKLEGFSPRQILENRLAEAIEAEPGLQEFISKVAAPEATPGGGSAAALAGSLAAALGEMVAGLTLANEKYRAVSPHMQKLKEHFSLLREELYELVARDAAAYSKVMQALKLPKETPQEKSQRAEALEQATLEATNIPLRTARVAFKTLASVEELMAPCNPNLLSDAASGAQLAHAALKAAQYNVLINLPGLKDKDFAESSRRETSDLARRAEEALRRIDGRLIQSTT
jgi:glutamate formiminotransferase/formiminotetrahydrofolate cyclodeaminase